MTGLPNLIRANASHRPAAPQHTLSQWSVRGTKVFEGMTDSRWRGPLRSMLRGPAEEPEQPADRLVIKQELLRVDQRPDDVLVGLPLSVHRIAFLVTGF